LERHLASQTQLIAELSTKVSLYESKIIQLGKELSIYRTKKNSSNSSLPPSQDPFRVKRTESLRERSGRQPGGQQGHEGYSLEQLMTPTEIITHEPCYCTACGEALSGIASEFIGSRQVIDIPPVKPIVTEHQIYGKRCHCGHLTKSAIHFSKLLSSIYICPLFYG
jgi:hypothetical protein